MAALNSEALEALLELPEADRKAVIKQLPRDAQKRLYYHWPFWARADQVWTPGPERHTVVLAGRGWGKTRYGAEACRHVAEHAELCGGRKKEDHRDANHGQGGVIGIAGRTANDVNETILHGPSGLITISPPWFMPHHEPSKKRLTWPNGVIARLFSGDVPNSFRGPNIGFLWADELAHWAKIKEAWAMAMLTLRLGLHTRSIVTTTPIGVETLIDLIFAKDDEGNMIRDPDGLQGFKVKPTVRALTGSTLDNIANLDSGFIEDHVAGLAGTRLGAQEIEGEILMGSPGAPWQANEMRRCSREDVPDLDEIVVAVDPAMTKKVKKDADEMPETGIVAVGVHYASGSIYVLEDASGNYSGTEWANVAAAVYHRWRCDRMIVEDNQGGELVELNVRNVLTDEADHIEIERVRATRSKYARAGMVNGIWQQGRAYHVGDSRQWRRLEFQMTHYDPRKGDRGNQSDRMDGLVWAVLGLLGTDGDRTPLKSLGSEQLWAEVARKLAGKSGNRSELTKHAGKKRVKFQAGHGVISLASWPQRKIDALVDVIKLAA